MAEYISKSALVAEIKKYYEEYLKRAKIYVYDYWIGKADAYHSMLEIIDTLEVKEVDLEKEIKDYFEKQPVVTRSKGVDYQLIPSGESIAKHFFELGLKAQKGE